MKRIYIIGILTIVCLITIVNVNAQETRNGTCLSRTLNKWCSFSKIELYNNDAYLVTPNGMCVVDITNPFEPIEIKFYPDRIDKDFIIIGNYSYEIEDDCFRIVDITDPLNNYTVSLISQIGNNDLWPNRIEVIGDYAYITTDYWLYIFDVSNPVNPIVVGSLATYIGKFCISNNYVFGTCDYDGLKIIDITNPTAPQIESTLALSGNSTCIAVSDNYAYLSYLTSQGMTGIHIISVSNPSIPQLISSPNTVHITSMKINNNLLYLGCFYSLKVYDLVNPIDITEVGSYDSLCFVSSNIIIDNNHALLSDLYNGLQTLDVTNLANLSLISSYNVTGYITDAVVQGDYAYVLDSGKGLQIMDVSNPANPVELGFYQTDDYIKDIAIYGNYVYILLGNSQLLLRVIDISNPINPVFIEELLIPSAYLLTEFVINDNYLYMPCGTNSGTGFFTIDISNPSEMHILSTYVCPGSIRSIATGASYVYITYIANDYQSYISVVDVSNPNNPHQIGICETPENVGNIDVVDNIGYLDASEDQGPETSMRYVKLTTVNLSNPSNPSVISTFVGSSVYSSQQIIASDGYAFLAVGSYLEMFYIANPNTIQHLGYIACGIERFDINGNLAYVAQGSSFAIYDFSSMLPNEDETMPVPEPVTLKQNYPNPFNPETEISYTLAKSGKVNLSIYNTKGQLVKQIVSDKQKSGSYKVKWDGTDTNNRKTASGVYFYRLETDSKSITKKCILMK